MKLSKGTFFAIALSFSASFSMDSYGVGKVLPHDTLEGSSSPGLAIPMAPMGEVDDDSWSNYLQDDCPGNRCADGTISKEQPPSRGLGGWEGKCGQTAASNLLASFCKVNISPSRVSSYMRDLTPGVRPDTLEDGLDELFWRLRNNCGRKGEWKWYHSKSAGAYLKALKYFLGTERVFGPRLSRKRPSGKIVQRSPLALLIRDPGSHNLHWITLVDIEESGFSCKAVVNHWDNQYKLPCSKLAKWSKGVNSSYPFLFKPYNMVALTDG